MKYSVLVLGLLLLSACSRKKNDYTGWTVYAGGKDGNRYSSNEQINRENVSELQIAWVFHSQDSDTGNHSQNQCNPIIVDGILYGTSPQLKLLALDAASGKPKWIFDPASVNPDAINDPYAYFKVNRGVIYWQNKEGTDKRILYCAGTNTYAVNALTGEIIRSFGRNGLLDLTENLDRVKGTYNPFIVSSTPGLIYRDLLIMGSRVDESADAAPGDIRAFDVKTGKLKWTFHTIPHPGEIGYESWPDNEAWKKLGGANSWAGMSLDEETGIIYIPTGSVSGDFYGGIRKGINLFANCIIALDAATGNYKWHYQVVHHDLWDRDLPANPNLVTIRRNGRRIKAVAQITKHGYVYVFERETGKPVFDIEERPFPPSDLSGEEAWPTQPIPVLPEPFARQHFGEKDLSDLFPEQRLKLAERFRQVKYGAPFTPPSKEGVWIFPGFDGGGEWGGAAVDLESGIMYVNCSELPWSLTMIDAPARNQGEGRIVYSKYCMVCHGSDLKGNGPSYASLIDLKNKYTREQVLKIISNGRNMMPAFKQIPEDELHLLLTYLVNGDSLPPKRAGSGERFQTLSANNILDQVPYIMTGYNRFLDENGFPGIKPPWGTLNAVDLNTGKLIWKVTLGEYEELSLRGIPPTGTENYGGPLVTKGGLVFIAATKDEKIRAFDKETGQILWEAKLPAAGYATPATYFADGRQYLVIACGGGKIGSKSGDAYVAFALPDILITGKANY